MSRNKYILFALLLSLSAGAFAQKAERDYIRKGNRLFKDSVFVDEMKKLSPVPMECFRLTREMSEDGRRELVRKLADYRRIVVSVSGKDADVVAYADFLAGLDLSVPLVYAFFTSYRGMQPLEPALNQASADIDNACHRLRTEGVTGRIAGIGHEERFDGGIFQAVDVLVIVLPEVESVVRHAVGM